MSFSRDSGFTLVELAIVMTIIGLLIGGVLKGQELVENARVMATVAQVKGYEAGVTAFADIYNAYPGDLGNAADRIPGCTIACSFNIPVGTAGGGSGDGKIGVDYYASQGWIPRAIQISTGTVQTSVDAETTLFFIHLLKANLLTGISDIALKQPTPPEFGVTHPKGKIGGGWLIGYANGDRALPNNPSTVHMTGMILILSNLFHLHAPEGENVITPARAGQIDRKMDDGKPSTGAVQAFGSNPSGGNPTCIETSAPFNYAEASGGRNCGVVFRLQN